MPQIISAQVYQNGKTTTESVTVTSTLGFSKQDEKMIVETTLGLAALHQSSACQNAPAGMIGYIHNYSENSIYAVTAMDKAQKTITIPKGGIVKNGVHRFK